MTVASASNGASASAPSAGRSLRAQGDTPPIEPREIRHLALEGGGGKGLAYVGAFRALEKIDGAQVLSCIEGIAGASAGAITALLFAVGYTPDDMADYMSKTDFNKFFDFPSPRKIPTAGRDYEPVTEEAGFEKGIRTGAVVLLGPLLAALRGAADAPAWAVDIIRYFFGEGGANLQAELREQLSKPPGALLVSFLDQYLAYLGHDMGLFSGEAARDEFTSIIETAIKKKHPNMSESERKRHGAITFKDLESLFPDRPTLIVTGSNLATGRTELFSSETTPQFPVADAVRISMSLPFIYKPYVLTDRPPGYPPCGTYVDGGLWNNLPFREFGATTRDTLSLRLEIVEPVPVLNLGGMLGRVANQGLFGTGESQVLSTYAPDAITLDTRGLSLIDFNPDKAKLKQATDRAARAVYKHWDRQIPEDLADPDDDKKTAELEAKAERCVGGFPW